jgi:transposase
VNKPAQIMALSFIMVWYVLISRVAKFRLQTRRAETAHTIPDQLQKPMAHPTMQISCSRALKASR